MKRYLNIVLFAAVLFSACPVYGVVPDDSEKWTLEKCIDYALENNITILRSKNSIETAEANLLQSKSSRLPSLSGSATLSGNSSRSFDNTGGEFSKGAQASLNTDVPIFRGGVINNNIKAGKIDLEKARLDVEEAQNDIVLSITQAWMNILFARENYNYYQDVVETSTASLERSRALLEAGSVSRQDLVEIQAQYASDRYSLVTAKNELDIRVTNLKTILDLSYKTAFNPQFPDSIELPDKELPDFEVIAQEVLDVRPEIENSWLSENVAQLDLSSAKAGYLLTLNFSASASSSYSDNYMGSFGTQMNDRLSQYLGLSLNIPIFSRNENRVNVARSKVNLRQAELNTRQTRNNLLQTLEQVYVDVKAQQERYDAALEKVSSASISYKYQSEQFELGMLNAVDLRQSKNAFLNANAELIQARYSVLLYRKILDFYRGKPISVGADDTVNLSDGR